VTEESFEEREPTLRACCLAPDLSTDVAQLFGCEVGEPAVLEVGPDLFLWIERGRVGREPDDVIAGMAGKVLADEVMAVRVTSVPEEHDVSAVVMAEMAQELDDLRSANVRVGM
jgi:hypothetical protein